jgi:glycosyltransferase involved in cell wall biosynthesis
MRILVASDFYPPFIGGAERQTQLLSRGMAQRGHTVAVATVWHAHLSDQEHDDGIAIHRLRGVATRVPWFSKDPKRRYHPPFPEPGIVWGLRRLIKHFKPDLVHASGWISYSCAAALVGSSIPFVSSARDYGYSCTVRTLLHYDQVCSGPSIGKCFDCASHVYGKPKAAVAVAGVFASKPLLRRKAAALHCVSSYVQRIMQRDFLPRWRLITDDTTTVIPDFVTEDSSMTRSVERVADEAFVQYIERLPSEPFILFVGSLQAHKGLYTLLSAYEKLRSRPHLVLMGTVWPDTPRTFPDGVTVLENVPHAAVMHAWRHCLFGVAPSLCPETFGGVITEAMSSSKAIVASNIGGPLDIIVDGKTGYLLPPGDVEALVATMTRLIDDPALRQRLGTAGQERVQRFYADTVLPQFDVFYEQLVTRSHARDVLADGKNES